ncbi:MAG: 2-C-methyl-D-erythritol 4-phosphate cytidylyltransferase [Ktedonobacterales bacterium]
MPRVTHSADVVGQGKTLAIVLCAGQGSRMGAAQNKIFLPLAGTSVGAHAISAFQASPLVDVILVIGRSDEVARIREQIIAPAAFSKVSDVVAGGATRHQSEERALEAVRARIVSGEIALVMIHDGARPLVTGAEIARLVAAVRGLPRPGGALLATPVTSDERIARIGADGVAQYVFAAGELWRAQTPQCFEARTLLAAYDRARGERFEGTDTASVVEAAGAPVVIAPGDATNIKVTTPDDLLRAEAIQRARREAG